MANGIDATSFEFYEGIRIFIPGAVAVGLLAGIGASFNIDALAIQGKELQAIVAALAIGMVFYFLDAPAKAAVTKPLQPTEFLRHWSVKPQGFSTLNAYLLMLDTDIPATIRARALYMGSIFRIGFETIYMLTLVPIAVLLVSLSNRQHVRLHQSVALDLRRSGLAAIALTSIGFAIWRERKSTSKKEPYDVQGVVFDWSDIAVLLVVSGIPALLIWQLSKPPTWLCAIPGALAALLWAYRYFRGYAKDSWHHRVPIDAVHASVLAGSAALLTLAGQFASAPRLSLGEETSWLAALAVALVLIVGRGHERRLRGGYSSQNTWIEQNKEQVLRDYFGQQGGSGNEPRTVASPQPSSMTAKECLLKLSLGAVALAVFAKRRRPR